jgi:hypothetical protein
MRMLTTCVIAVALAVSASAQAPRVVPGNRIYVDPATDFGVALSAAIVKKKVPVVVTTNRDDAHFIVNATSNEKKEGSAERVTKILAFGAFAGSGKEFSASVMVTNPAGDLAFAYNVKKSNFQSAAEAFAKHLNNHIKGK